jgi:two-component system chemotaxis response regulator CheB
VLIVIKVLIIQHTALLRQIFSEILSGDPYIEVVGIAQNATIASEKIKTLNPDVLTLDVAMPNMDAITFLRELMVCNPVPVVMVSSLTENSADVALQALELGAVDYVFRPGINREDDMRVFAREIIHKVKIAARARIRGASMAPAKAQAAAPSLRTKDFKIRDMVIAMGASTGGTEALRDVLCQLPVATPGIVITQHIPAAFSKPFAARLNAESALTITQATDGQPVLPGHAYLAPGDRHLEVIRGGEHYMCRLRDSAPVNRHKPSVEVMFNSVAKHVGSSSLGVLLTGMGDDGSDAMGAMQKTGAPTIAQDEASSVVWGMPGEAVKRGYADEVVSLQKIAERILYYVSKHG